MWTFAWIRTVYIVGYSVRAFIQILWFQGVRSFSSEKQQKEAWERLVALQALRFKRMAERLQGLTIKVGQFLSTRVDILPESFTKQLETLTDHTVAIPWKAADRILRSQLGDNYDDWLDVNQNAVASASIAVVFKAEDEHGNLYALKVQRPNIPKLIRADLRAVRIVMTLARWYKRTANWIDWQRLYKEVEQTILQELDFRQEIEIAKSFDTVCELYQIRVPRYDEKRSTSKVLMMDWIDAEAITNDAFRKQHGLDDGLIIERLVKSFIWQIRNGEWFHADPHPGNIRIMADGTIVFLDFGMVGKIREEARNALIQLIQSIIVRNQQKMTDALQQLGFVRKGADMKELQRALDQMLSVFLEQRSDTWDQQLVERTLEQVRYFVNKQPIQLPADFAFIGRAMSMLVGIVTHVEPDIDYLQFGKKMLPELKIKEGFRFANIREWLSQFVSELQSWLSLPSLINKWMEEKSANSNLLHYIKYLQLQQLFAGSVGIAIGVLSYFGTLSVWMIGIPLLVVGYLHVKISNLYKKLLEGGRLR